MMMQESLAGTEHAGLTAEALSRIEMMEIPERADFAPDSDRVSRWWEMSVFRAGWGTRVTTSQVIETLSQAGLMDEDLETKLHGLGFSGGYRFADRVDIRSERMQELQSEWAARLVWEAMHARGWDGAERLYLGSSSMSPEAVTSLRENLRARKVTIEEMYEVSLACNGATQGIIHALKDDALQGKRVVVAGMDTLTGTLADTSDPVTWMTFGNGGGVLTLVPGLDMEHLYGYTQVEYDEVGITKCSTLTPLPGPDERMKLPDWLRLKGAQTAEKFAYTRQGLYIEVPYEEGVEHIEMKGIGTFKYFVLQAGVSEMMASAMSWYLNTGGEERWGRLGRPWGHQPSLAVVNGLNKKLGRHLRGMAVPAEAVEIPWVMAATGFTNMSAGTPMVALEEQLHQGMLDEGRVHAMLGLGVGATAGVHLVRVN